MSTKIFPFRRFNPTKGEVKTGLPDRPKGSGDDRRIMRQLIAEQTERMLAVRAAAMPQAAPTAKPPQVSLWGFEPEYIMAFDTLARRYKRSAPRDKRRALEAGADFLQRFRKGEKAACEFCEVDITTKDPEGNRVPHGVFVYAVDDQTTASGLCRRCAWLSNPSAAADDGNTIVTIKEWMITREIGGPATGWIPPDEMPP